MWFITVCERNSKSRHLGSIVGSCFFFFFYSLFLFSHPGRHPGRWTAREEHSQGDKGVGDKKGINSGQDDTWKGRVPGTFLTQLCSSVLGKDAWWVFVSCLLLHARHHLTPSKSFSGTLSVHDTRKSSISVFYVLISFRTWAGFDKWSLVYYWFWPQSQQTRICVYTFIAPIYNFRLEVGWEIFKKWNHVKILQ